jgi:hypothetical protein
MNSAQDSEIKKLRRSELSKKNNTIRSFVHRRSINLENNFGFKMHSVQRGGRTARRHIRARRAGLRSGRAGRQAASALARDGQQAPTTTVTRRLAALHARGRAAGEEDGEPPAHGSPSASWPVRVPGPPVYVRALACLHVRSAPYLPLFTRLPGACPQSSKPSQPGGHHVRTGRGPGRDDGGARHAWPARRPPPPRLLLRTCRAGGWRWDPIRSISPPPRRGRVRVPCPPFRVPSVRSMGPC